MADKLMVASRSFITNDEDGKRVIVHKGTSRFRSSHAVVKQFPQSFKAADDQPDDEDTMSRPGRRRGSRPARDGESRSTAKKSATSSGDSQD